MDELPVLVTVIGAGNAPGERITLTTRGLLGEAPHGWTLQYEETEPNEMLSTTTLIECTPGQVVVHRLGAVASTVIYRAGEMFEGDYKTPAGAFRLRIYSSEVQAKRRGAVGYIRLTYQVTLSTEMTPGGDTAMRKLDIRFRPCR